MSNNLCQDEWIVNEKKIEEIIDPYLFLRQDVLEIRKELSEVSPGRWTKRKYSYLIAFGGPGIWVDSFELMTVDWWGEHLYATVSEEAQKKIELLDKAVEDLKGRNKK